MPVSRIIVFSVLVASFLTRSPVDAATIEVVPGEQDRPSVIVIEGEFRFGDEKQFVEKALKLTTGIVVLSSDGGNAFAAIEIGRAIRLKEFVTAVPDGAQCASACALAWLGGQTRFMAPAARIGFHAVYRMEDGEARESGAGNALVGAYLNSLGLAQRAIFFITQTSPKSMTWLTFEDAARHGIDVKRLNVPRDRETPSSARNPAERPKEKSAERQQAPPISVSPTETPFGVWALSQEACRNSMVAKLVISARRVTMGSLDCTMHAPLQRSGRLWTGDGVCWAGRAERPVRAMLSIENGRLFDRSVLGTQARLAIYERCMQ